VPALTVTERRVTALVAEGMSNSVIASALGISRRTVESHVSSCYRKLEVISRVALARVALAHDIR
jgi:DNA-binding NarL/FixJ family response regulator